MKETIIVVSIICSLILALVLSTIGYNLYTNAKNREQYELCLKIKSETNKYDFCYPPR